MVANVHIIKHHVQASFFIFYITLLEMCHTRNIIQENDFLYFIASGDNYYNFNGTK